MNERTKLLERLQEMFPHNTREQIELSALRHFIAHVEERATKIVQATTRPYCPRPGTECKGACKAPGCAVCPNCEREFFLEEGEEPGALCCICKLRRAQ